MIDFRLKTFIDLCDTKSYTKTAKNLSITQPAVSQHIKYLEEKYDLKLFDYIGKRLSLTKEGIDFFYNVQKLQTVSLNIENHLKDCNEKYKTLRFGATRTVGEFYLPNYIKKFLIKYPKSDFSMIVNNTKFLLSNLNKGNIEFAIIEGHFNKAEYETYLLSEEELVVVASPLNNLTTKSNLSLEELFKETLIMREKGSGSEYETYLLSEEELVVVASPLNNLTTKSNLSLEELFKETLIMREKGSGSREIFDMYLYENNYSPENFYHSFEVGNINIIKDLVKDNLGISIMYKKAAQIEIDNGDLIMLDVDNMKLSHEFNFIFLKDSIFHEDYIDFYNFLINP